MKFRIESRINDGLAEAPPMVVMAVSIEELVEQMLELDTFTNDYGIPLPIGATVKIVREE